LPWYRRYAATFPFADVSRLAFQPRVKPFHLFQHTADQRFDGFPAYNVSVTVVDAAGLTRAVQRMDNAGPHTLTASYQKAFTSASSGAATSQLLENSNKYPAAKNLGDIPGFLLLAGGVPVKENNATIGAIGIGGAPSGDIDEACALDAIKKLK
jgi:uncharacterized protein GlcG (DUF336 family)